MKTFVTLVLIVVMSVVPAFAQQAQQQQPAFPVIAQPLLDSADQSLSAQEYDKAVRDLSLFILFNPTFSPAYFGRAQGYVGLNDLDSALGDVNHALDTLGDIWTPDYSASLYALRGQINQQQQRPDDALSDFTQSITIQPTTNALTSRAMLYLSKDDAQSALKDLDSAITLDSTNPVPYIYRGLVDTRLKDVEASGADYLQFFNLIQASATTHAAVQSGQTINLQIDRAQVVVLPFTAAAGQYMTAFAVARSGDVDPLMVLIDRQGTALAGDDDSGGSSSALIQDYPITTAGQYALVVGHSLGGFTGQVVFQLQLSDTPSQ